jgi:hypothetical protein
LARQSRFGETVPHLSWPSQRECPETIYSRPHLGESSEAAVGSTGESGISLCPRTPGR